MTTAIEVKSINRPSSVTDTGNRRKDSQQRPWTRAEIDNKRNAIMVSGLLEVIDGLGATEAEITKAMKMAIELAPKRAIITCCDCRQEFGRLPGIASKRCAPCADVRRNEMDEPERHKAPAAPRLRHKGTFVSREQAELGITNTKRTVITSDEPCRACGQEPPRGNRFCNKTCYRKAMKGVRHGTRQPVQNRP